MKEFKFTDKKENLATFFVTVDGDVVDTLEEAEITGCAGKVIVDGFFVGSVDEMRQNASKLYHESKEKN